MRKTIMAVLLLVLALPAVAQDESAYHFLREGYGFFTDIALGAIGKLEPVQSENPPLAFDFDAVEVTWAMLDMEIVSESTVGTMTFWELTGGTVAIYEDPAFDLNYGASPAEGLPTATNGTAVLTGPILHASMFFNNSSGTGSITGDMDFTGGTRFAELEALGLDEADWHFNDPVSADASVPAGYHARWAGRITGILTIPTADCTWTRVRALY
jgi:hypothetical protein